MNDIARLQELIAARHPCIFIVTDEELHALAVVRDAAMQSLPELQIWSVVGGLRDGWIADPPTLPETEHPAAALFQIARRTKRTLYVMLDLVGHLRDERTLRTARDAIRQCAQSGSTLILIDHRDDLPPVIAAYATRFDLSLPDDDELDKLVRDTLRKLHGDQPITVDITRRQLETILRNLRGLSRRQAEQIVREAVATDRRFDASDLNAVMAGKRRALQRDGLLEYIEAPTDLNEIGGLRRLKDWLRVRESSLSEQAAAYGLLPPRGILMLGVQGAGKSLCAKAIATAWGRPLLRMDPGALYDKYVGESEKRLRDALRQAERMSPIILWIDEIEKAFASAAARSTDGGLSQRMFATLLTWMQEHTAPVFLVATANDIEALPPELLRKGRFDEIFFVDLPEESVRRQIFEIHLKKRKREVNGFDLAALSAAADGYSGAEIEQAVLAALHQAFSDNADLDTPRLLAAVRASRPLSVTMGERIEALREWARDRCVPAD